MTISARSVTPSAPAATSSTACARRPRLAHLCIGDDVRINHTISPQDLRGLRGTITDLDDDRATVCLHRPVGRFHTGEIRYPPLTLDKLDKAS